MVSRKKGTSEDSAAVTSVGRSCRSFVRSFFSSSFSSPFFFFFFSFFYSRIKGVAPRFGCPQDERFSPPL